MDKIFQLGRISMILPAHVLSQGPSGNHMDGYQNMMYFWGGGIVMWVLLLAVVGILVYFLMQNIHSRQSGDTSHDTPLEILKKRYARGEITKEELEDMKKSL